LKDHSIWWKDNLGAENEIHRSQTVRDGDKIAWWQINEVGKDLVRICLQKDRILNWRPPINTMGLGSAGCSFIAFCLDFLILKYRDKHRERIFIIQTQNILAKEIQIAGFTKELKLIDGELFIKDLPSGDLYKVSFATDNFKIESIDQQDD